MRRVAQCVVAFVVLAGFQARASITVLNWYRLGEADPGAVAGNAGNSTTVDSAGGHSLTKSGTASYSATAAPNSTLSMLFSAAGYYSGTAVSTSVTDNFGIEAWINPSGAGYSPIFYNGDSGGSGFGLYYGHFPAAQNSVTALFGGVTFGATDVTVTPNQWHDVALVRASGVTTLYLDGTAYAMMASGTAPS